MIRGVAGGYHRPVLELLFINVLLRLVRHDHMGYFDMGRGPFTSAFIVATW